MPQFLTQPLKTIVDTGDIHPNRAWPVAGHICVDRFTCGVSECLLTWFITFTHMFVMKPRHGESRWHSKQEKGVKISVVHPRRDGIHPEAHTLSFRPICQSKKVSWWGHVLKLYTDMCVRMCVRTSITCNKLYMCAAVRGKNPSTFRWVEFAVSTWCTWCT